MAEFLNEVYLARLGIFYHPTCVGLNTVACLTRLEAISCQWGIDQSALYRYSASLRLSRLMLRQICRPEPSQGFGHHFQSMADLAYCVTPSLKRQTGGTGILNLFPITYAFRPWLRGRLTLGGRTFPRKSWDYGGRDSRPAYRYSCPHNHFHAVHPALRRNFDPHGTLLYHAIQPKPDGIRGVGSGF